MKVVNWFNSLSDKSKIIYVIIAISSIVVFGNVVKRINRPTPCQCLEYMVFNPDKYRECIDMYKDEAIDYKKSHNPNFYSENTDAIVQAYWMEQCK
ncbi:MAG: hypothetical protein WCG08_12345 [Paludibacter sp.]